MLTSQLDELIKMEFIPVLGIGMYYFGRRNFLFHFLFCTFFLSMVRFTGRRSKRPSHGGVALPQLSLPDVRLVLPLRWSLPFLESAGPPGNLPEEKRPPGRGARKPPRVRRVIPCQVGRKYRQGVPAVLFPFFREDIHQFPHQNTSGFPR